MTERLYYLDSSLLAFSAEVLSSSPAGDGFHVRLNRTAFYPTSGGQPFDTGTLGGARVREVIDPPDGDESGEIVHVVDKPLAVGSTVDGAIDRDRRLDHMQQHTGQHILSAAFDRTAGARTVSFHLGAETSTIDLAREVSPAEIAAAERAANDVVWDDRRVAIRFATDEEAAAMPLRKESARTGTLRLIEVPGFDLSACGGTHVASTGVIGIIAVSGWERFKGGSRVSFVCGARALRAHAQLRDTLTAASRALSVGALEVPETIIRLQAEAKTLHSRVKQLQEQVTTQLAGELRASAVPGRGGSRVLAAVQPGWDAAALKHLALAIVSAPGMAVVLMGEGQPVPVVVARSSDVALDAGAWMKDATVELGGRGGGRPELAQGGLTAGTNDILARANRTLIQGDGPETR
jgi:alanyl-tRNA synthetase